MWQFRRVGISDPYDFERHLNDLVVYYGEYFSIGEYSPQGRLWRDDVIVGVNAIRVYPEEELVGSEMPDAEYVAESARPSRGAQRHRSPDVPALSTACSASGSYWNDLRQLLAGRRLRSSQARNYCWS